MERREAMKNVAPRGAGFFGIIRSVLGWCLERLKKMLSSLCRSSSQQKKRKRVFFDMP
jgi:hypothetical protein